MRDVYLWKRVDSSILKIIFPFLEIRNARSQISENGIDDEKTTTHRGICLSVAFAAIIRRRSA